MNLESNFIISHPRDEVWNALLDVEEIAPCIPGFTLEQVDGDQFRGKMKIKIGAITTTYRSTIVFLERDEEENRVVISAKGKEIGGQGSVDATVTADVGEVPDGASVEMNTELAITGRVAQFGRGIISDVSDRLIKQFVKSFEAKLDSAAPNPGQAATEAVPEPQEASAGDDPPPIAESEPLNLAAVAAWPVARRALPVIAVVIVVALIVWIILR